MKATGLFVLYTVPIGIILALFFALLANEKLKGIGFFRTVYSSTMGISVAASSVIWLFMFNPSMGMFNRMLSLLNLPQIQWLLDPEWALLSVSISTIWMNIGFSFLILLGGLQNIDEHLYESSRIDGAGYFYRLRRITLPMLSPTLFFIITISFINAFQSFGQIDILTQGGPSQSTNSLFTPFTVRPYQLPVWNGECTGRHIVFIILIVTILQFELGERKVHYQ